MPLGQHDAERHPPDDTVFEPLKRDRQVHEGQVNPACAQRLDLFPGQAMEIVHLHLGVDSLEGLDDRREEVKVKAARKAQHETAGHRARGRARLVGRLGRLGED